MPKEYTELMDNYEFSKAFDYAWDKVQMINRHIDDEKPWSLAKNGETDKLQECMVGLISELLEVNYLLKPFIPGTTEKIEAVFGESITPPESPLFPKTAK